MTKIYKKISIFCTKKAKLFPLKLFKFKVGIILLLIPPPPFPPFPELPAVLKKLLK